MSYKFDEASLKDDDGNIIENSIKLEILNNIKKHNNKEYMSTYNRKLFCPECHIPQLCLVLSSNKTDYYLKGFPKQMHAKNCSYSFLPIKCSMFKKLLESPDSRKFINSKLNSLIDKLSQKPTSFGKHFLVETRNNQILTTEISEHKVNHFNTIRRLSTKSLTAPFEDDDYNVPKLFYGNVDIKFNQRTNIANNNIFYSLTIFKRNANNVICSVTMSEAVFSHINSPIFTHF